MVGRALEGGRIHAGVIARDDARRLQAPNSLVHRGATQSDRLAQLFAGEPRIRLKQPNEPQVYWIKVLRSIHKRILTWTVCLQKDVNLVWKRAVPIVWR